MKKATLLPPTWPMLLCTTILFSLRSSNPSLGSIGLTRCMGAEERLILFPARPCRFFQSVVVETCEY